MNLLSRFPLCAVRISTGIQSPECEEREKADRTHTHPWPTRDEEQLWLDESNDPICLAPQHKTSTCSTAQKSSLIRRLLQKNRSIDRQSAPILYSTATRCLDGLRCDAITVILGRIMLSESMWWLNHVDNDVRRLAIITVFVFFFAFCLTIVRSGRPFEKCGLYRSTRGVHAGTGLGWPEELIDLGY